MKAPCIFRGTPPKPGLSGCPGCCGTPVQGPQYKHGHLSGTGGYTFHTQVWLIIIQSGKHLLALPLPLPGQPSPTSGYLGQGIRFASQTRPLVLIPASEGASLLFKSLKIINTLNYPSNCLLYPLSWPLFLYYFETVDFIASTVAQQVKPPPAAPASHVSIGLSPGCSTFKHSSSLMTWESS